MYAWGTFRDGSGVMGFSDAERIQLVPVLVYQPTSADLQVVKVVSGPFACIPAAATGSKCSYWKLTAVIYARAWPNGILNRRCDGRNVQILLQLPRMMCY